MDTCRPAAFDESIVSMLTSQEPPGREGGAISGRLDADLIRVGGGISQERQPTRVRFLRRNFSAAPEVGLRVGRVLTHASPIARDSPLTWPFERKWRAGRLDSRKSVWR
jgi:hypothetical protein